MKRRTLIRGAAGTLAGTMLTRSANAAVTEFQPLPSAQDERMKMLIMTAVDAAKSAGAHYADARLTFSQAMEARGALIRDGSSERPFNRFENLAFGIRARYDGYWGFAASPVWTTDEAARLGRRAVDSAKANLLAKPRDIDMAPNPGATSGDWVMPVKDDPFEMDPDEIPDYLQGLQEYIFNLQNDYRLGFIQFLNIRAEFNRQQKAFGNSEGQFVTQRLYRTGGKIDWWVKDSPLEGGAAAPGVIKQFNTSGAGCGFELIRNPHIREWCRELYEELAEERFLPIIPVDVGRYDCLIHPDGVAPLVKKSIGVATEIDRVMGFEASTTGTSYIIDPNQELGSLKIGAASLNVTATRSSPGRLAHVKWDDEGVAPKDVELVKDGIITNLQTGREGTAWMKGYLEKSGQPIVSNGSMYGIDAHEPQAIHSSDLILHADPHRDTTLVQLREQLGDGIEFKTGSVLMDFQQATGLLSTDLAFQIKKGKRVARIAKPGIVFRTSELWGNLKALGGTNSSLHVGTIDYKSNPSKRSYSSVDAPPAIFKEMSVINPAQKA